MRSYKTRVERVFQTIITLTVSKTITTSTNEEMRPQKIKGTFYLGPADIGLAAKPETYLDILKFLLYAEILLLCILLGTQLFIQLYNNIYSTDHNLQLIFGLH